MWIVFVMQDDEITGVFGPFTTEKDAVRWSVSHSKIPLDSFYIKQVESPNTFRVLKNK